MYFRLVPVVIKYGKTKGSAPGYIQRKIPLAEFVLQPPLSTLAAKNTASVPLALGTKASILTFTSDQL